MHDYIDASGVEETWALWNVWAISALLDDLCDWVDR